MKYDNNCTLNPFNNFKHDLGEAGVQVQYIELAMRTLESDYGEELENRQKLIELAKKNNLTIANVNKNEIFNKIGRSYLVLVHSAFEEYLQRIYERQKEYSINFCKKTDGEPLLSVVIKNLYSQTFDKDNNYLIDLCTYYRLVRNSNVHENKITSELEKKYEKIRECKINSDVKFGKLNAPNRYNQIGFDDFIMYSRASADLADKIYKSLVYDYSKIVDHMPKEVINTIKKNVKKLEKSKKSLNNYISTNFNIELKEEEIDDMIRMIVYK